LDPSARCTADEALQMKFFMSDCLESLLASQVSQQCDRARPSQSQPEVAAARRSDLEVTPGTAVAMRIADLRLSQASMEMSQLTPRKFSQLAPVEEDFEDSLGDHSQMEYHHSGHVSVTQWPPLWLEMVCIEAALQPEKMPEMPAALDCGASWAQELLGQVISSKSSGSPTAACHNWEAPLWSRLVNGLTDMVRPLDLYGATLHLAASMLWALAKQVVQGQKNSFNLLMRDPALVAVACMKLAACMEEHSGEYYLRDVSKAFATSCTVTSDAHQSPRPWLPADVVEVEKLVAVDLNFELRRPTMVWFLRACISVGDVETLRSQKIFGLALFYTDLLLLDGEVMKLSTSLCAQCALLLAIYNVSSAEQLQGAEQPNLLEVQQHQPICLPLWDPIRRATCAVNKPEAAANCLQIVSSVVLDMQKWHDAGCNAARRRHWPSISTLAPLRHIPVAALTALLLPVAPGK